MTEHPSIHNRRLRMLYSIKDIQLALSAATFLDECDPEQGVTKIELRRFKCYETTAIISYARPFSESRGAMPKLSLKMIDVKLDSVGSHLHDEVIELRNKAIAHSDAELMRMAVKLHQIDIGEGKMMPLIQPAFDEGLDFLGDRLAKLIELFHTVHAGLQNTLLLDARRNPEKFAVHEDYLHPRQ